MASGTPRTNLIPVAAALYRGGSEEVKREMQSIEDELKNQVYGKMWEVCGSNPGAGRNFGQTAFYSNDYSPAQKIDAVERVITDQLASQTIFVPRRLVSEGARSITYEHHYDGGFDYRFNFEGTYYLDPAKSFWRRPIGVIQDLFAYMMFVLRTSFCRVAGEKKIRSLILKCASSERVLSSYTYNGLVKSHAKYPIEWIQELEHGFFEDLSALYKALFQPGNERIFPSEMLRPIHDINKPQSQEDQERYARPGWIHGDLSNSLRIFMRLAEPSRALSTLTQDERVPINRELSINHQFVPHYIFIDATRDARVGLKTVVRNIRQTLGEVTIGKQSIEDLRRELLIFKATWDAFIKSHEVLGEAQSYLSQNDFYAPVYDKAKQERTAPFYRRSVKKVDDQTLDNGIKRSIEQVYLRGQPLTPTGRIFQNLREKAQQRAN